MESGEIFRTSAFDEMTKEWHESIELDVFEDEVSIPRGRRKKRRSSVARRVSFAEENTIHVFVRDDDYATPPELKNVEKGSNASEVVKDPVIISPRRSPRLSARKDQKEDRSADIFNYSPSLISFNGDGGEQSWGDMDTGSSTDGLSIAGCDVGDEAAGPVDIWHITRTDKDEILPDEDITLDSHTFSLKFRRTIDSEMEETPSHLDLEEGKKTLESSHLHLVEERKPSESFHLHIQEGKKTLDSSHLHLEEEKKTSEPGIAEACVRGVNETNDNVESISMINNIASVSDNDMSFTAIVRPRRQKRDRVPGFWSGEKEDPSDMSLTYQCLKKRTRFTESPGIMASPSMELDVDSVPQRRGRLYRSFMSSSPENSFSDSLKAAAKLHEKAPERRPLQELNSLQAEQGRMKERNGQISVEDSIMQKDEPMEEIEMFTSSMDITYPYDKNLDHAHSNVSGKTMSMTIPLCTVQDLLERDEDDTSIISLKNLPGSSRSQTPSTTFHLPTLEELLDRDGDQTALATVAGAHFSGIGNRQSESTFKVQNKPIADEQITASEKIKAVATKTVVTCQQRSSDMENKIAGLEQNFSTLSGVEKFKEEEKPAALVIDPIRVGTKQDILRSTMTAEGEGTCSELEKIKDGTQLILETTNIGKDYQLADSDLTMEIEVIKKFGVAKRPDQISVDAFCTYADIQFSLEHQVPAKTHKEICLKRENYNSLFDRLKFVCLVRPEVGFLQDRAKQLHMAKIKLKDLMVELECCLSSRNPAIFSLIQTVGSNERLTIESYLKKKVEKYRMEIKLKFERENLAWLQGNKEAIVKEAEAARDGHKRMKMLSDRCELLESRLSLALSRARTVKNVDKKLSQEDPLGNNAVAHLRLEHQDALEQVISLRQKEEQLTQKVEELESSLLEALENIPLQADKDSQRPTIEAALQDMERKINLVKHLQGWQLESFGRQATLYPLKLNYYGIAKQSLVRQGEGGHAYVLSTISINSKVIDMVFPRVNASTLFEALLPSLEKGLLSSVPSMLQRLSFLVGASVQICKEVRACRIMFRGLDPVHFVKATPNSKVLLTFTFTSYALSLKMTLNFETECFQKGTYPVDIVPASVQIVARTRKSRTLVTEEAIREVVASVPSGYHRFERLCQSVYSLLESLNSSKGIAASVLL
ncbi:hypothetical protein O6H91_06G023200 [Diphasiastrum complanatum]|uniref:Uncharacterized protein n=2 Tax=Diphasiastrum complanatum TaxID=34168 RepID=A0ACC2DBS2_DIPCM|nr:hypothetical protein O6H91_06G023200 [Diphasiastrum complanatum]